MQSELCFALQRCSHPSARPYLANQPQPADLAGGCATEVRCMFAMGRALFGLALRTVAEEKQPPHIPPLLQPPPSLHSSPPLPNPLSDSAPGRRREKHTLVALEAIKALVKGARLRQCPVLQSSPAS